MYAIMSKASRLAVVALLFAATSADAFPQRKNLYLFLEFVH
jgi:hypothetical protein